MKILSTLTLIAVVAALVVPEKAEAGDSEKALIGGLIGGIVIGTVLADNGVDTHVSVGYHNGHRGRPGYWNWVSVRTWVPGYYERSCDRWGRPQRIWISGHYTHVRKKVWVDGHHGRRDYGHHYRHNDHRERRDHWRDDRRRDRRDGGRHGRGDERGGRDRQQHAGRF